MPKKHKTAEASAYERFLAEAPGAEAMIRLFSRMRGILFCLKDRDGRYLCANDAFLHRTRTEEAEGLIGKTARELFPALLAAGYEQQDTTIIKGKRELHDRLEMITNRDGSLGWYLSDKVPVRNRAGEVIGIAGVSRDLKTPAADDPRMGQLADSIERMRHDYTEPLRITELAEQGGMSLSKFERLMKSILQVSPRQFLTRLRVEAAADRLRTTRDSLGEIALDCGFCDQPTFCRQFKATTGITASRYRNLTKPPAAD